VYYKGAWVLHTLRFVVGDQHFFRILREFLYPGLQYGGSLTTDIHEATDSTSSLSGLSQSQVQKSSLPLHQTSLPPLPAGSGHIRSVDSAEFKATAEQVFGQDLDWFFDVYLHQAELPLLVVSRMGGILNITWDVAGESAFPMPLEVSFDGEVVVIVPENNRITLEVEDGVEVILDPNRRILNEFQLRQL
jgi:aminopeptidase N